MSSDAEARGVTLGVLEHHGHLGPRVLEHIIGKIEHVQALYSLRLEAYVEQLIDAGPVAARLAGLLALLDTARELVEGVGYPARPDVMARAVAAARQGARDSDRPLEALRAVLEHCASHSTSFYGRHELGRKEEVVVPARGWLGAWPRPGERRSASWGVAILETALLDILQRRGFDAGVIDRWVERGWIARNAGGSRRTRVRIDGTRVRALAFTTEAVERAGVSDE